MSRALNLFGSLFQSVEAECLHDRSPYVVVLTFGCCSMSCSLIKVVSRVSSLCLSGRECFFVLQDDLMS